MAKRNTPRYTVREPFSDRDWIFEPKWDGFRALAYVYGHRCQLVSRRGNVYKAWPYLCEELAHALPCTSAVLDGEIVCLLSLQWWQGKDLDGARPHLHLPAAKTKTKPDRVVPVSTRLKAILEMRRKDPAGEDLPPEAYVFGNALGQRTASIKPSWNPRASDRARSER